MVIDTHQHELAHELCEAVDWTYSQLADSTYATAFRAGEYWQAALGFIRHLRERERPHMGYTAEYITRLRNHATVAFREEGLQTIQSLLSVPFMGGDWPDGRGTLLHARPEVLQVAGRREDFDLCARCVATARAAWSQSAIHTIMYLLRYLQAVWPLEECTDEAILPLLTFLVKKLPLEWESARHWGEVTFGTEGHNWYVAQFGATWKAGLLFPEFTGFARFQTLFPTYFEREMQSLFTADGFTREASVSYHSGTIDLLLDIVLIAEYNSLHLNQNFYDRLRAAYAVEWKLMCPDGGHPPFGDIWVMGPYYLNRMRVIAAILGFPEAKYLAESFDPAWNSPFGSMLVNNLHYPSVGEDVMPAYQQLAVQAPVMLDTALPESGYYVMRENWTRQADYAAIEASAKGNIVSSHGHSAIFDLILYSKGRPILVGNGKGPDEDVPCRIWRVSSQSHNVAIVDGEEHLPLRSYYRFERVVVPTVDEWISTPDYAYFSGAHEAYERLPMKVSGSRRKLFYRRGDYWILIDRFTAASPADEHIYQQRFQVGVPIRLLDDRRVVTSGEGGNLLFVPVPTCSGVPALSPHPFPLEGYANPTQLTFTHATRGNMLFITVLAPFLTTDMPDVSVRLLNVAGDERQLSPWEVTGMEIILNGRRDLFILQHMPWNLPWTCGGHQGTERVFHACGVCNRDQ